MVHFYKHNNAAIVPKCCTVPLSIRVKFD